MFAAPGDLVHGAPHAITPTNREMASHRGSPARSRRAEQLLNLFLRVGADVGAPHTVPYSRCIRSKSVCPLLVALFYCNIPQRISFKVADPSSTLVDVPFKATFTGKY